MTNSSKFLANIKNHLVHVDRTANFQNKYITLPGFGFNKTRRLHRESDEKHYLPIESSSTPKTLSEIL